MENHSNPPPPAMHPAMLMAAANPFVAYALGNQFIPHTQASVMQGAALIGPHGYFQGFPRLEGIPGYPAIVASSGTQPVHESIDHGAESSETWSTNPTSSNQERRGRDDERYKYDDRRRDRGRNMRSPSPRHRNGDRDGNSRYSSHGSKSVVDVMYMNESSTHRPRHDVDERSTNRRDRNRDRRERGRRRSRSRSRSRSRTRRTNRSRWSDDDSDKSRDRSKSRDDDDDMEEEEGEVRKDASEEDDFEESDDRKSRRRRKESSPARRRSPDREAKREKRYRELRKAFRGANVLLRNVDKAMDDVQLMEEIKRSGVQPVEVRVLRYRLRNAEQAQGFGVIEFERKEDANAWVENFQNRMVLSNGVECSMEVYGTAPQSMTYEQFDRIRSRTSWSCVICRGRTGRNEGRCHNCYGRREDVEVLDGLDLVSAHSTTTILVRNLEPWTTEDSILRILQTTSSLPIKKISLREAGKSGVVCLIEMYNISDAGELLRALEEREFVTPAGREPVVTYGKPPTSSAAATSNAIDSAQWASKSQTEQPVSFADKSSANSSKVGVPIVQQMPTYDPKNPEQSLRKLAEYSASVYAATPEEWQYYMNYYKDFYAKQAASGSLINSKTQSSAADAAALAVQGAVAKSRDEKANTMGILQAKAILGGKEPLIDIGRIGEKGVQLPPPDTLKYVYDPSSGYYLDPVTHLYYDANTTYYYDAHGSRFLYWDREEQNYLPVNGASDANSGDPKKDKAQAAKKIAKDMEKWAKSMNQKKQSNSSTSVSAVPATTGTPVAGSSGPTSGAADAGFAVLQGKSVAPIRFGRTPLNPTASDFDESNDAESNNDDGDASEFTDWNKLACLLCKRQFPSREVLMKHNSLSALHKENMEKWRMSVAVERKPATEPPRSMYGLHGIKRHR